MKNKTKAMTLVELVCVIAIIAVLIAIAVMGYHGVQKFQAERQIHTIVGDLSDLRKNAMLHRKETSMYFGKDAYVMKMGSMEKSKPYESKLVFYDYRTSDGQAHLTFSSSGRPSNSGTITFRIGRDTYRVIVSPVNARIRMESEDEKEKF